jgi:hypothetical protein
MCCYAVWTKSIELNAVSLNDSREVFTSTGAKLFLILKLDIQNVVALSALEVTVGLWVAVESVRAISRRNLLNLSQICEK